MLTNQICQAITLDSPPTIRDYFKKVLELANSGVQFPVKLVDVWHLVYTRKGDAVRSLTNDFENEFDYQLLRTTAKQKKYGHNEVSYELTVSCMEFFIARKVRAVFDVYREVFHWAAKMTEQSVHVPQQNLINQIARLEKAVSRMRTERVTYFHAKVSGRQRQKEVEKKATERETLFSLWERYIKLHNFQAPSTIMDSLLGVLITYYKLDLRIQVRKPGEHYFDVAIRFGVGHCVLESLKSHMYKSGELK